MPANMISAAENICAGAPCSGIKELFFLNFIYSE